jgi:hypothetical protein
MVVENDPANRSILRGIAKRIGLVNPDFCTEYEKRVLSRRRGRVVVLSGFVRDVTTTLAVALNLGQSSDIEEVIEALRKSKNYDRVAIVWDEFGRHLEGLITEGRPRDLDVIQRLAEVAVRSKNPKISLTVLLHQNLLAHARSLNQTTLNEWRKIEGRFTQVRFVEDSREVYGLIATAVEVRSRGRKDYNRNHAEIARKAAEVKWFDGMEESKIADLLLMAHPVSAGALQVLPRLVARVGQNERSLLAFLDSIDNAAPIGLDEVYLYFSDAMRTDAGVGGLHRRWVEVESARGKVTDPIEREALSAAFMLQIGVHGERRHLPLSMLELAMQSKGHHDADVRTAIKALIERKLLLYRKLNDDVSVWHGADIDLDSLLREKRMSRAGGFNVCPRGSPQC